MCICIHKCKSNTELSRLDCQCSPINTACLKNKEIRKEGKRKRDSTVLLNQWIPALGYGTWNRRFQTLSYANHYAANQHTKNILHFRMHQLPLVNRPFTPLNSIRSASCWEYPFLSNESQFFLISWDEFTEIPRRELWSDWSRAERGRKWKMAGVYLWIWTLNIFFPCIHIAYYYNRKLGKFLSKVWLPKYCTIELMLPLQFYKS